MMSTNFLKASLMKINAINVAKHSSVNLEEEEEEEEVEIQRVWTGQDVCDRDIEIQKNKTTMTKTTKQQYNII